MKTATEKLNVNKMSEGTFYFLEPQTKNTSFAELRELLAKRISHPSRTLTDFHAKTSVAKINTLILA